MKSFWIPKNKSSIFDKAFPKLGKCTVKLTGKSGGISTGSMSTNKEKFLI
jgi:hypothetical protein